MPECLSEWDQTVVPGLVVGALYGLESSWTRELKQCECGLAGGSAGGWAGGRVGRREGRKAGRQVHVSWADGEQVGLVHGLQIQR